MLATSQEQYNQLLTQGYSTEVKPTPATSSESDAGGGDGFDGEGQPGGAGGGFSLSEENREALASDPLKFGTEALGVEMPFGADTRDVAGLGLIAAGPAGALAGGFVGAAMELDNIAKAKAGLIEARAQNLQDTPEFAALDTAVKAAEKNLSGPARFLSNVLGFGSGENYAASVVGMRSTPPTGAGVTPSGGGGGSQERFETQTPRENRESGLAPDTSRAPTGRPGDRDLSEAGRASKAAAVAANKTESQKEAERSVGRTEGISSTFGGGRATGGLVARPSRKKPVAKKK